jgi:hypothetical protein
MELLVVVFASKASMLQNGTFLCLPYPLIGHIACVGFSTGVSVSARRLSAIIIGSQAAASIETCGHAVTSIDIPLSTLLISHAQRPPARPPPIEVEDPLDRA